MIYIFSSRNSAALMRALLLNEKKPWAVILKALPSGHLSGEKGDSSPANIKFQAGDQAYLDISGMSHAELKKALAHLNKHAVFRGIIDPKGEAEDPSAFFFEGFSDYIGSALVKKGLGKKRFAEALSRAAGKNIPATGDDPAANETVPNKKIHKLPAGKFEGWKSIRSGTVESFFFLFASVSWKSGASSMAGATAYNAIKKQLPPGLRRDVLQHGLGESNALLWMESEDTFLFLIPPRIANCRIAVEAVLKMILNSRLIGTEMLDLAIPIEFTFALHYGKTVFEAPGKTGSIISDAVNYIFHLGTKKSEPARLTVSDDVPDEAIPEGLQGLFKSAGTFEGIPIRHSRRFINR